MNRGFVFNDAATTEIYTLALHEARPICPQFATQQVQHGRFGLATPTALVRAVRTEVASLDRDPKACEIGEQMLLKIMIVLFAVVAPTDAALVCNDRKRIPSGPKTLQALNHAG